jgi:hypothetical protein
LVAIRITAIFYPFSIGISIAIFLLFQVLLQIDFTLLPVGHKYQ